MDERLRAALDSITTYLAEDEEESFEMYLEDGGDPKGHIYYDVLMVEHLVFDCVHPDEVVKDLLEDED